MKEITRTFSAKCVMCGFEASNITHDESLLQWGEVHWGYYSYAGRTNRKDICPNCMNKILKYNNEED